MRWAIGIVLLLLKVFLIIAIVRWVMKDPTAAGTKIGNGVQGIVGAADAMATAVGAFLDGLGK